MKKILILAASGLLCWNITQAESTATTTNECMATSELALKKGDKEKAAKKKSKSLRKRKRDLNSRERALHKTIKANRKERRLDKREKNLNKKEQKALK